MTDEEKAEKYAKANMHYEIAKRENGANYAKEVNSVTIKQAYLAGLDYKNKENAELKEENKFLKEQCLILADGNVCSSTCSEIKKQLTKAKEIIKDYMTIAKGSHSTVCGVPEENRTIYVLKLNEEAEQFIKEVEK